MSFPEMFSSANGERTLYFRTATRITDLPAFKQSKSNGIRLFSQPPRYDPTIGELGQFVYKVKVDLKRRHHIKPALGYQPGEYYVDSLLSAFFSDDVVRIAEILTTNPESILALEELGVYDRTVTVEDLLKGRAEAHGIDVQKVTEAITEFEESRQSESLPEDVKDILRTLEDQGTLVKVDGNKIILNQGRLEYYQTQREKERIQFEQLKQQGLDPAARLTFSYQELQQKQIEQILSGATPERTIQRLNSLYDTPGFSDQQRLDLLQRLLGPSLGVLEADLQSKASAAKGLASYVAASATAVAEQSVLKDYNRLSPLPPPRGFIDRPTADTYRAMYAEGNVRGVHFQFQNLEVLSDVLSADPSRKMDFLVQRLDIEKIKDPTARSIFAANEIYLSADVALAERERRPRRIKGVYYDYSFHPKVGYVYGDDRTIKLAYIGTQNQTAALEAKHSVENLMVFRVDEDSPVESEVAMQLMSATNMLHDYAAGVLAAGRDNKIVDRNALSREYSQILNQRRLVLQSHIKPDQADQPEQQTLLRRLKISANRYVYFNEQVQDRMLETLSRVFSEGSDPNTKMILSFGDISALYAKGDNAIKDTLRKVLLSGQGTRLKILTSQEQLFGYLESTGGGNQLIKDLIAAQVIKVVPTGLQHDKSYVAYRGDLQTLMALGTGSSNLSLTSRFKDIELGVHIDQIGAGSVEEALYLESIQPQVASYYASLLSNANRVLMTAEYGSNLMATQLLYDSLLQLQSRMGGDLFKVQARYDLSRSTSQVAGVGIQFGGRNLVLTTNSRGQVVIANDKRVIGGSIFKNDTAQDWVLDLPGMQRTLRPSEAVKLDSLQTAVSLVGSIATAANLEMKYGAVNQAFAKVGHEQMFRAMDSLMADLLSKYTSLGKTLGVGSIKSVRRLLTDLRKHPDSAKRYAAFQADLSRMLMALAGQMFSSEAGYTPTRNGRPVDYQHRLSVLLNTFEPILTIDAGGTHSFLKFLREWDTVRDQLINRLSLQSGGIDQSFLLQDLKAKLLQYSDLGSTILQAQRQGLINRIINSLTSPYLPAHEAGGSAAQRVARLPVYSVSPHHSTGDLSLTTQMLYNAHGFAFTNPATLKHAQSLGLSPGSVFRSLSSTAYLDFTDFQNLNLLRMLATTDGEYAGAAVVFDTDYLFKAGPAIQYKTAEDYYSYLYRYLQTINANPSALAKPTHPDAKLFLLPFSKPEQITQRLKNYIGAKQMFEVAPGFRQLLQSADLSVPLSIEENIEGDIASTVSELQYAELMSLKNSGWTNEQINEYYRKQLILNESAVSGFIKGASLRRVAYAMGYGQLGDTIYANAAFFDKRMFASSSDFNIRLQPRGLNQPQRFVAELQRKLAGAVIYSNDNPLALDGVVARQIIQQARAFIGEQTISNRPEDLEALKTELTPKLRTFFRQRYDFADIDFVLTSADGLDISLKSLSLRKGVYNYVDGELKRVFRFDRHGRLVVGATDRGDWLSAGLEELSISLPGYSRRHSKAITLIEPNLSVVVSGNLLLLQGTATALHNPVTGDRGGEGYQVKGPLQILERHLFDSLSSHFEVSSFRGTSSAVQQQDIMAVLHPGVTKGFTYEAGLDILSDAATRTNLVTTMRVRSLDSMLSLVLLLGAGKQSEKLKASFVTAYADQGDTAIANLLKYGWADFTTSKARTDLVQQAFGLIKLSGTSQTTPEAVLDSIRERILTSFADQNARAALLGDISNLINQVAADAPSFSSGRLTFNEGDFDVRAAGLLADAFSLTTQILHSQALDLKGKNLTELSLVDASGRGNVARYQQEEQYRIKVQSMMTRMGISTSELPRLPQESDEAYKKRNEEALAGKLRFMQVLLNRQIFVERAVAYNPSRSLVATGMKDTVGLEYQYLMGMTSKQYQRLRSFLPGLVEQDYNTIASAYAILTQINVHTDALTEFQTMRLRSTLTEDHDSVVNSYLVNNFTEFLYDAPVYVKNTGEQTTIFAAALKRLDTTTDEIEQLRIAAAYEHFARLTLGKTDSDDYNPNQRLKAFLENQYTARASEVLGVDLGYVTDLDSISNPQRRERAQARNKLLEDILVRSLDLGPNRLAAGLLALESHGMTTGNSKLQDWARTTTLEALPNLRIDPTPQGTFRLTAFDGYEYGVVLGTDVLSSYVLTSPGYAGGIASNQMRIRQLQPQVRSILSRYTHGQDLTAQEASMIMEYRKLMQLSVTDTISLATTEYARKVTAEGLPNPGVSATAISGYLADIDEVFAGDRMSHLIPNLTKFINKLAEIEGDDLKSNLKKDYLQHLLALGIKPDVAVNMLRAGAPSYGSPISQEHTLRSVDDLVSRAHSNNSALALARSYAGQTVYMPSVGRFFTQGSDFDGDSYAFMLKRERYFNEYVSLVRKDIERRMHTIEQLNSLNEQRIKIEKDKQQVENVVNALLKKLGTRSSPELIEVLEKYERKLKGREQNIQAIQISRAQLRLTLRSRDPELAKYEAMFAEHQRGFEEQKGYIQSDIRRWTASYAGLPETLFADAGDDAFKLAQVMHLNEQFRGIDALSDMGESPGTRNYLNYLDTFTAMNDLFRQDQLKPTDLVDMLRSSERFASLSVPDQQRLEDYLKDAFINSSGAAGMLDYDQRQQIFEAYLSDQMQRSKALTATNTKVFTNAAGTVLDATTFDALQAIIGTQGTSFIGETYNAITPLMYKGVMSSAFAAALSGSRSQLLEAITRAADPSSSAEQSLIAKLSSVDLGEVALRADRRWKRVSGLLESVQQIARDSLKEKSSKGVLQRLRQEVLTEDGRTMTLAEYMQDAEVSDDVRQLRVKNFMSMEGSNLKSFGAIFLLSDYMKAGPLDLQHLVTEKPGDDLRNWIAAQYSQAGQPTDVDTFLAGKILDQLNRISAEFSINKMLAPGNIDWMYDSFSKRAAANLRAADLGISYDQLSDYERLLRDQGDVFQKQYIEAFKNLPASVDPDDVTTKTAELEQRLLQLHSYEAQKSGAVSVDMIKSLRRLRNERYYTDGSESILQTMEYLQRGKLTPDQHQGILARLLDISKTNDYSDNLTTYLGVVGSEISKDMNLTETEHKLFYNLLTRGEKGSRGADVLAQYSAGVSEWIRTQEELRLLQTQVNDPEFASRSSPEQNVVIQRMDQLIEQSEMAHSNIPFILDLGKKKLESVQLDRIVDPALAVTSRLETTPDLPVPPDLNLLQQENLKFADQIDQDQSLLSRQANVINQLNLAQNIGIWGGPLMIALLAGNQFRPDERTALAGLDILQSAAVMQAGMGPDAAQTSSWFRRQRLSNAMQTEGSTFGALQGLSTELFMSSVSKISQDAGQALTNRFNVHDATASFATEFLGTFASLGLGRIFSYLNPTPYHDAGTNEFLQNLRNMFVVRAWNLAQKSYTTSLDEEEEYHDSEDALAYIDFKSGSSIDEMQYSALMAGEYQSI